MTKFARFNQNMMKSYVDVQTKINAKRMEEVELQNAKQLEQQQQEERIKEQLKEKETTGTVLTPAATTANLSM